MKYFIKEKIDKKQKDYGPNNYVLAYLHFLGGLLINKFSLPYIMIRLHDNSNLYDE